MPVMIEKVILFRPAMRGCKQCLAAAGVAFDEVEHARKREAWLDNEHKVGIRLPDLGESRFDFTYVACRKHAKGEK